MTYERLQAVGASHFVTASTYSPVIYRHVQGCW